MRSVAFKASWLFLLLPLLSGCIGIELFFPKREPVWVKSETGNTLPEETCTSVMAQHGERDHQSVDSGETTLVYRDGVAWGGIMPVIIFPIPVALLVYPESVTYMCRDDQLISVYRITTRSIGAVCVMLDEGGRWRCDAHGF